MVDSGNVNEQLEVINQVLIRCVVMGIVVHGMLIFMVFHVVITFIYIIF